MFFVFEKLEFPDPNESESDGLLAIGGDLSPERLLLAYRSGIFPWFVHHGDPYWFCPPKRFVLFPEEIRISKSMKQVMRSDKFSITQDQAFEKVIVSCGRIHKHKDGETWINNDFIHAYTEMHRRGHAHSVEVWCKKKLVGGLYGIVVGKIFCGESMFSDESNASKAALIHLCTGKKYSLIDCQVYTPHLERMGARLITRKKFLDLVKEWAIDS